MNIKPTCVIVGPVQTRSGYGDHSRDLALSIIKSEKYDVKIVSTRWGSTPMTALDSDTEENKLLKDRFLKENLTKKPELFIQISIPNEFQPQGKFNIGITAGIESTLCRAEWIEGLNRMDLNIVPSNHAKEVFLRSKYKKKEKNGFETSVELEKPVEVLFEGSDLSIYGSHHLIKQTVNSILNEIPEDFCYLFVGHWLQGDLGADRKDVGMLVKIFSETFKNKKTAPALILKTSGASFSEVDKDNILQKIKKTQDSISGETPNVYLIHGDLEPDEVNSLYNHNKVKAHVSFTHGEGYGRPLQEASLSGKPVIASNWSGHVDFLDDELAVMLPGKLENVHKSAVNDWLIKDSKWFVVNYSAAAQKFEDVYKNYDTYLEKAKKLAKRNETQFSREKMDSDFIKLLDAKVPEFSVESQVKLPKLKKLGENQIKLPKLKKK